MDLGGRNALDATWNNVVLFLETFDPRQVRHAHDIFRRLFEAFYAHAVDTQKVCFLRVSYSCDLSLLTQVYSSPYSLSVLSKKLSSAIILPDFHLCTHLLFASVY